MVVMRSYLVQARRLIYSWISKNLIDCENLTDQEFEGKIFLTRGVAGRGGHGGDGGGGALFGSSGSDGWDGSDGRVLDYVSGSVGVPDGKIIYN